MVCTPNLIHRDSLYAVLLALAVVARPAPRFLFFDPNIFPQAFAHDLPPAQGAFPAAAQIPPAGAAFSAPITKPAWKSRRTWFVLATDDRVIPPAAQERMAQCASASVITVRGSHLIYMSQPEALADAIEVAAKAVATK